ncbi:MAG: sigma-70 family RNA polymerase sigma factor [Peptostreptococcales bacterium]
MVKAIEDPDTNRMDLSDKELFELYQKEPSLEIRNEIVERYLYLVDILIKRYLNKGIEYDDLYQVGALALIRAVERFDVSKGYEFGSFLTPTVLGEIKKHFRDKGWALKVPRKIQDISLKLGSTKEYLTQKLGRNPKVPEIAEYIGCTEEEVLQAMEVAATFQSESLSKSYNTGKDDYLLTIEDLLGEEDQGFHNLEMKDFVDTILQKMNIVERKIFERRFLENQKQVEIAKELQVSQMTISRMEKKIVNKFKLEMSKMES